MATPLAAEVLSISETNLNKSEINVKVSKRMERKLKFDHLPETLKDKFGEQHGEFTIGKYSPGDAIIIQINGCLLHEIFPQGFSPVL
jgi:hypothetical protein